MQSRETPGYGTQELFNMKKYNCFMFCYIYKTYFTYLTIIWFCFLANLSCFHLLSSITLTLYFRIINYLARFNKLIMSIFAMKYGGILIILIPFLTSYCPKRWIYVWDIYRRNSQVTFNNHLQDCFIWVKSQSSAVDEQGLVWVDVF